MIKTIRVLHTEWSNGWGGQEIRIIHEMKMMRSEGAEVYLACRENSLIKDEAIANNIKVFSLPFRGNTDLKTLFHLKKIIKYYSIDIVNTHSGKDTWVGGLAAKLTGVKFIRTRHLSNKINPSRLNFINELADYIFTTGGIGPTHDDITAESVAKALNDKVILNQEAKQILIDHYGQNNVNEARLKMAALPSKAILLNNSITSAPGFMVENIIVMAGVPKIMRSMFNSSLEFLDFGDKILSKELKLNITESFIAKDLAKLQHEFPDVTIGSYPFAGGTSIVFRSFFEETLNKCYDIMSKKRYE